MKCSRLFVFLFLISCSLANAKRAEELTLLELQQELVGKRFVDLTHAFAPGIPHWPGFPDEKRKMIYGFDNGQGSLGSGFFAETFSLVGQWGMLSIHRPISAEAEELSIRSRLRK